MFDIIADETKSCAKQEVKQEEKKAVFKKSRAKTRTSSWCNNHRLEVRF
jgi:hypothetical protein